MKYAVGRNILEHEVENRRAPGLLVHDDVPGIDGRPAAKRCDLDSALAKRLDEMPSDEPLPAGDNGFTHGPKMLRDLPRTSSGPEQSRRASRYRAKHNCHGSRPRC